MSNCREYACGIYPEVYLRDKLPVLAENTSRDLPAEI